MERARPVIDPALLNGAGAPSKWANLGYWRETRDYPTAAAALARRVGRAAQLATGDVVLDVACGSGDSLALWMHEFGVQRVVGVEPDVTVVEDARARVHAWGLSDRVTLVRASAESLVPDQACPGLTAITCIDAAYHFASRVAWLAQLAASVPRGTRLGLADLLVVREDRRSDRARASGRVRELARRADIPQENLWTAHDVEPVLSECGWVLDRLVRCGPEVLGGFRRFALRSAWHLLRHRAMGGWRALGTALALRTAGGHFDYAIIAAHRA